MRLNDLILDMQEHLKDCSLKGQETLSQGINAFWDPYSETEPSL